MPSPLWLEFANQDHQFALWLERVDHLCDHLLNMPFHDVVHEGDFDAHDSYRRHVRPDRFVADCVIPYLIHEHGAEMIFDVIGENTVWGQHSPLEPET